MSTAHQSKKDFPLFSTSFQLSVYNFASKALSTTRGESKMVVASKEITSLADPFFAVDN